MPKSPRFPPNPLRVIDVQAYPAVQLLDVIIAGGTSPYAIKVVSEGGQDVTVSAGLALATEPLSRAGQPMRRSFLRLLAVAP